MSQILVTFGISCAVAALASPLVIRVLTSLQMVDEPGSRTSHVGAVPRGGGLAVVLGGAAGLQLASGIWTDDRRVVAAVVIVLAFATLGFIDDLRGLSATFRLVFQLVIAVCGAALILGLTGPLAAVVALLTGVLVAGFVNAFNFMDGINGISAATASIVGVSLVVSSIRWDAGIEIPALSLVGAAVGFTPFNAKGRVFLGDVGSYAIGSALAMLTLLGIVRGIPVLVALVPLGIYLSDVAFTLGRRALRNERLMQAHREHVYQRLANDYGWGHINTTLTIAALTGALVVLAQLIASSSIAVVSLALLVVVALLAGYVSLPFVADRQERGAFAQRRSSV